MLAQNGGTYSPTLHKFPISAPELKIVIHKTNLCLASYVVNLNGPTVLLALGRVKEGQTDISEGSLRVLKCE